MSADLSAARFGAGELEDLMARYQQADAGATRLLLHKLSPQFFQFFLSQVRDRSRAEDLLQDFWLRIHSARQTYRRGEPVLPWLYAIARRVRVDQYRKMSRISRHEMQVETLPDPPAGWENPANDLDLQSLLAKLPESQQEVIVMLKVSGLSLEEVARATHSTVGSVKQKAHRAYTRLRAILESAPGGRRSPDGV